MSDIRAFLAIRFPPEVQQSLAKLQEGLRPLLPQLNWVRQENIHVTLKFFGYIPLAMVDQLHEALREVGPQITSFSLNIQGIGVFPHLRSPRVLWAGLTGSVDRLIDLHDQIQLLLEPFGFPIEEKPFHPHVTLARIKSHWREVGTALKAGGYLDSRAVVSKLSIDRLVLYRSELSSSGPCYEALWNVPLSRPPERS